MCLNEIRGHADARIVSPAVVDDPCAARSHVLQGIDVIFIKTAMRLGNTKSHAVVDCVPVLPAGYDCDAVVLMQQPSNQLLKGLTCAAGHGCDLY